MFFSFRSEAKVNASRTGNTTESEERNVLMRESFEEKTVFEGV